MKENKHKNRTGSLWTTLLIVMVALVCVTFATMAWFSIADRTRLKGVKMDITTGKSLRFDLESHDTFEEYRNTLSFEDIADAVKAENGIDIADSRLEPVTTENGRDFYYENGDPAEPGDYIEFTLHFMATSDMHVHLTSEDSEEGSDGTRIVSDDPDTVKAMRMAFEESLPVNVYDPEMGDERVYSGNMVMFGLLPSDEMKYNSNNMLFDISEGEDVPVTVRIWLEGNDGACTNDIKDSDYSVRLRFMGTDEDYSRFG